MTDFVIYRAADGVILRTGSCSDPDHVAFQAQEGEVVASIDYGSGIVANGLWAWNGSAFVENSAPAPTLDDMKRSALTDLASIATAKRDLWSGGQAPAGGLQVDDISTGRMTSWAAQALVSKVTGAAFGLPFWIMADNSHHTFTGADDFLTFAQAAAAYKTAAILNNSALKAAINAAADETALNAIDINGGWPA